MTLKQQNMIFVGLSASALAAMVWFTVARWDYIDTSTRECRPGTVESSWPRMEIGNPTCVPKSEMEEAQSD